MDATFGLQKPFDIDHGELDACSKQESFVLGYELGRIDAWLQEGRAIVDQPVHSANRERILDSLRRSGKTGHMTHMPDDISEEWMLLTVRQQKHFGSDSDV